MQTISSDDKIMAWNRLRNAIVTLVKMVFTALPQLTRVTFYTNVSSPDVESIYNYQIITKSLSIMVSILC